jgi:NAD(P)-dependent dehydrogenase (short-subunit alcohol dehydrogenase family)/pimeloyl-ACP methyl ester carboxylesterase
MTTTTFMIDSAGVPIAVTERGDRDRTTVVLVHGYPDTSAMWNDVADVLAERFHVVTYDVRGSGASGRPRQRSEYRLDRLTADLRAVIAATSPNAPVHLVGHDWGSVQSWEAVTDPGATKIFASFTSISGPSIDHASFWARARLTPRPKALFQVARQARRSWYMAMFQVPLVAPLSWRLGVGKAFGPAVTRMEGLPARDDWPAATVGRDGARGVQIYRANIPHRMRHPQERRTTVPVQVIVPKQDRYLLPRLYDDLAQWTGDLWIRKVHAGHWVAVKAPRVVAGAVTELIDLVETGTEPRALRRLRARRPDAGEFADRLVVITGAGSGIGRETALAFGAAGAEIVVADLNGAAAEETVHLLQSAGATGHALVVDVADVAAMEEFAKRVITDFGVPDVVVNNAGIGVAGAFLDTSATDWERIVDINLLGVVHGCRLFGQAMADRLEGGHIVNIASAAAFLPSRTLPAYSATKAAVLMLSECLGAELADWGIGVSAICPGIINTPITTTSRYVGVSDEEQDRRRQRMAKQYARRNFGPEKVAAAIVKAVREKTPVVPVAPEASAARFMSRLSPGALRRFARLDPL